MTRLYYLMRIVVCALALLTLKPLDLRAQTDTSKASKAAKKIETITRFMDGSHTGWILSFSGGPGKPLGDLEKQFGLHGNLTGTIGRMLRKNWSVSVGFGLNFGDLIKYDPFPNLRDGNGNIYGVDGTYAQVKVDQRSYTGPALLVGKRIHLSRKRANWKWEHALVVSTGPAWFFNKLIIQDVSGSVPLLTSENRKGFDDLRAGPGFQLEAGYWAQAPSGRYAGFIQAVYGHAWTQSLRSADYSTFTNDTRQYSDGYLQVRLGIALLFHSLKQDEFFYY